ncbi:hypothetical protein NE237_029855 [Protea cynaroides]|uniref:Uncharacterized protein n=1 Tax=Protea cynaroides TaxID=273540 RepID=A0A9Q0GSL1_9MAGN|nr:hypothetical protein NE237_029855 [Protea cynaroides]
MAKQEKLEKEKLARGSCRERELAMERAVNESKRLQQQAEENSKLRDFLMDRGVVDILQYFLLAWGAVQLNGLQTFRGFAITSSYGTSVNGTSLGAKGRVCCGLTDMFLDRISGYPAELSERRRLKKLRQKEQKSNEQSQQTDGNKEDSKHGSPNALDDIVSPTEKTSPEQGGGLVATSRSSTCSKQLPKSQKSMPNGLYSGQNALQLAVQKHGSYKEQRTASMANGQKYGLGKPSPKLKERV